MAWRHVQSSYMVLQIISLGDLDEQYVPCYGARKGWGLWIGCVAFWDSNLSSGYAGHLYACAIGLGGERGHGFKH